ncbi:MAG TPA: formylglycine-generating enzyme family protein [Candidatus Polarisedimenticolia bacterium]|nr:formylglycine-generating enzyme family protein [Candidatus Polarisedimenticolia bacterium]
MIAIVFPLWAAVVVPPANDLPVAGRVEMRLEIVADRRDGPAESCEAIQTRSATGPVSFAFWGTLAEPGASGRCGAGVVPDDMTSNSTTPSAETPALLLIHEVSADVGWDAGTMDPGPVGTFQVFLTLRTRQSIALSKDDRPQFGAPVIDRRSIRLEPGDEFVVPLAVDARGREALGVHQVLVRVRAGWAGREGATEYGALAVTGAMPGSEVALDGGLAGHAGPDGGLRLSRVPVGQREVRLRGSSGPVVSRTVLLVKGRTVQVSPEAADGGSASQPSLEATGKNAEGFQEYRRVRDGATMVEIPEGEFLMGNLETEGSPQPHTVFVSKFLMDKLPLTVGRYRRFATATGRPLPPDPYWGVHEDHPVAFVRWDEAKAYCEWAGGRLPTEAEREKATRGTDGRLFPWGSEPPSPERAVFRRNWGQQGNDTAGVRPAGAGPYGLLDTGGNMWEYCEDWYSPDYYASSPKIDPAGPKTGRARIVKGGSWDSRPTVLSASSRNFAYIGYREGDFGFRCAANPPR